MAELGRAHAGLPDDLVNFHDDPVTCAVALGWTGAIVQEMRLRPTLHDRILHFEPHETGPVVRVVVDIDGDDFAGRWLAAVETAQR
jgi:hypothetical protein